MSRLSFVLAFLVALPVGTVLGQDDSKKETPRIVTADGVKLNAVFYPSDKKNMPAVIMLHPLGEGKNIRTAAWKSMAAKLQEAGYSVMMFDFRGHGESTSIDDLQAFLGNPPMTPINQLNRSLKRKEKESIDYKDFKLVTNYYPVLVNDIAAVKAFLDRKNDSGACNTASTIVIGAEQGATLGAIWINSEWARYRYTPAMNMFMKPDFEKQPQGKDIIALITLTPTPKLGARTVSLGNILKIPCKDQGMADLIFYGKDDPSNAKTTANALETYLKSKGSKKHEFIGSYPLDTKLSGVPLLQIETNDKKETTQDLIVQWLEKVVAERGNEWIERDAQNALSMWRFPKMLPAKTTKGEKNLNFNDYSVYAQ